MTASRALMLAVLLLSQAERVVGSTPSPDTLTRHEDMQFRRVKDYLQENNIHVEGIIRPLIPYQILHLLYSCQASITWRVWPRGGWTSSRSSCYC